jgi:AmmeMemoRadiSam system protein B
MKNKNFNFLPVMFLLTFMFFACNSRKEIDDNIRPLADTVGFAQYGRQMDSIMKRIAQTQSRFLNKEPKINNFSPKVAISPHDDYSYVGYLYPAVLKNIKAKTIIFIGVAHKAKKLNLEDQIIFDNYDFWKGPYGKVKVSDIRNEIIKQLPGDIYQVNDTMQKIEHSVEAIIPFLQYYNRDIEIVSILVPYMSFQTMDTIAKPLAEAIHKVTKEKNLQWGKDFAIVISTDAVHYGDEDWGGKNFAYYGTDSSGYAQALAHEQEIIGTLTGELVPEKVKTFTEFTVEKDNYKTYKWTWCGRSRRRPPAQRGSTAMCR